MRLWRQSAEDMAQALQCIRFHWRVCALENVDSVSFVVCKLAYGRQLMLQALLPAAHLPGSAGAVTAVPEMLQPVQPQPYFKEHYQMPAQQQLPPQQQLPQQTVPQHQPLLQQLQQLPQQQAQQQSPQ
eukprot:2997028-Amphidinium_carterae.1